MDEIATGFGRTGEMFACNHADIAPDIMCLSKGLTGGYMPMSLTVTTKEIFDAFYDDYAKGRAFMHSHTYSGNPLGCAAALAVQRIFREEPVLENARANARYLTAELTDALSKHPNVGEIRHIGLIHAVELVKNPATKEAFDGGKRLGYQIYKRALKNGLLLRPLGDVLYFNPPLNTTTEELKTAVNLATKSIAEVLPFDVPGHKHGRGNADLTNFLGEKCLEVDVNSMKMLDNLCHPVSVIKDAETLAAEAFGASHAYFMVGGTTSAVQAMVLAAAKRGEKIIMPRNVHRSAINALILSGAVPVYVNPETDSHLGIALGMRVSEVERAIKENSDAKAVLVNNPTYYGICSNLSAITKTAHEHGMLVLVDEAHGTHLYFNDSLPLTAMAAGADMAAISIHKSGGSLTQSSLLVTGDAINAGYMHQIINITQTTSGSYLLMVSLDISRRNLALHGKEVFDRVINLTQYARDEINAIGDYYAYGREIINGDSVYDFDVTKLAVFTLPVGLAGVEVYDILRDEYDIQIEFGDIANFLAYVSVGDRQKDIERLVAALSEIRRNYRKDHAKMMKAEYISPKVVCAPQDAFYADKESLPLDSTAGRVAGEFVMCYPPGVPILAPGEQVTKEIIEYIHYAKRKGCQMTGPEDMEVTRLNVLREAD